MVRAIVIAIGVGLALANGLAHAQGTGAVRVQVNGHRDVHGSSPTAPPGKAEVKNLATGKTGTADLSGTGRADFGELTDGTYLVTVSSGDRIGTTYVTVSGGRATTAELSAGGLPTGATFGAKADDLLAAVRAAIAACDRAAYDKAVTELDRDIAMLEVNLRDLGRAIDEYGRLTDRQPDVRQLRAALSATGSLRRAGAAADPGLQHIPAYIGALEEKARLETRLNALRTARQQVPPYPQPCGEKKVGFLGNDGKGGFGLAFGVRLPQYDLPNYKGYSLEDMGVFLKKDILNEDREVSGVELNGGGFYFIPGTNIMMRFGGSYLELDSRARSDLSVMPLMGQRFDIPTPNGGFFTTSTVDKFRVEQQLRQYQFNARIESSYNFNGITVKPNAGVNFSYIDAEDSSRFKIAGGFARFQEWRSLDTSGGGPIIGLEVEVPIERGMYVFGNLDADLRFNSSKAKWKTQLDVTGNPTDKQSTSESDSKVSWGGKGTLGVGYRGQNIDIRLFGTAGISNHYPLLDIQSDEGDGDPSIEWKDATQWAIGVETLFKF